MGLRGPKSKAELALVASSGGRPTIDAVQRPRPPAGMSSAQKEMWTRIVEDLPADWFRKHNFDLLAQYCRHVDASRKIASLIEAEKGASPDDPGRPFNLHRWAELLALQDRESRALPRWRRKCD
jgi:hypothetical protein